MAIYETDAAKTNKPAPTGSSGAEVLAVRGVVTLPDTLAINELIKGAILPAWHVPVDVIVDADDLDSATSITLTAAVLNAGLTDIEAGTNFFTASTIAQGGGLARMDLKTGPRLAVSSSDRYVGLKVVAAAGTPVAGDVGFTMLYRPA